MNNKHDSILQAVNIKAEDRPYRILTGPTHERYETNLSRSGHEFYAFNGQGFKKWETKYGKIPDNYYILEHENWIPETLSLDFILSQNKFSQFGTFKPIADNYNLPLISLEHTWPPDVWTKKRLDVWTKMRGDFNVFISKISAEMWGFDPDNDPSVRIINHGIDTNVFKPDEAVEKDGKAAAVVNQWIDRDYFCGYGIWTRISNGLPVKILGDTPGLSKPAKDTEELIRFYQSCSVFVNTAPRSPIPTVLLEAMACGCAVVSLDACAVPDVIENGVNGFLYKDEKKLHDTIELLIKEPNMAKEIGAAARETILKRFNLVDHIGDWNGLFNETIGMQHGI